MNVVSISKKQREKLRKEVLIDPPVNADTILLKIYRKLIDRIFCMDCITECEERDASCWEPKK